MSNFQMPCFDEGTINGRCIQFTEDWRECSGLTNGATWETCPRGRRSPKYAAYLAKKDATVCPHCQGTGYVVNPPLVGGE